MLQPMHLEILEKFPIMVQVQHGINHILKLYPVTMGAYETSHGKIPLLELHGHDVPITYIDEFNPSLGLLFFFTEDNPHALAFKIKYATGAPT